jgi:hypothetical protein
LEGEMRNFEELKTEKKSQLSGRRIDPKKMLKKSPKTVSPVHLLASNIEDQKNQYL